MQSIHRPDYTSRFRPIFDVLRTKKYLGISLPFGLIYAFVYMFAVGIVSYVPGLISASGHYPMIRFTHVGISVIPVSDISFFILYGALAFLIASSFLVGLNVALMFYSRKVSRACGIKNNKRIGSKGFLGLLPAFFTSFACCGGGLLALVIGPTVFSSLSLYGQYMAPITVAVLAAGTFFISNKISKMERHANGKGKKVEDIVKPSVDDACKSCLSNHRLYRTYLPGRSQN